MIPQPDKHPGLADACQGVAGRWPWRALFLLNLSCARAVPLPLTGTSHPSSSPSGRAQVNVKQLHNSGSL